MGAQISTSPVYPTSHIKADCRVRATKAQMAERRAALADIVAGSQPMTVRQVFYQASVKGLVEKDENGYAKVQTALVDMRRARTIPYEWISDSTRWMRKSMSFNTIEDALDYTARTYRKALWSNARTYVEFWIEKDALAGVVLPVTDLYDVPLMVARGFSGDAFLYSSAQWIAAQKRPAYIYHLGDFDPSGVCAAETIEKRLREYAPNATIHFQRVAVTQQQISQFALPTRATKMSDSRAKRFGPVSVDLDAMSPDALRWLVRDCIERHLTADELRVSQVVEASEREALTMFARAVSEDDE